MATYIRLTDYKNSGEKEQEFFNPKNKYEAKQENFFKIPGGPIAYWIGKKIYKSFSDNKNVGNFSPPKTGMTTGDDNRFLRQWYEVSIKKTLFVAKSLDEAISSKKKWFPYNKGGIADKWFGTPNIIVNWEQNGIEIKEWVVNNPNDPKTTSWSRRIFNSDYFFREGATWTLLNSSGKLNMRYLPYGQIMNVNGPSLFPNTKNELLLILGFLNSNISSKMLNIISPTLANNPGDISKLPIISPVSNEIKEQIETLTQQNIDISKEEWDCRETSWDFTKNELIKHKSDTKIETAYSNYCNYWKEQHNTLHQNEEELNRLFIDIYELQDELTADVASDDITILKREVKVCIPTQERGNEGVGCGESSGSHAPAWELVFQADEIMKQFISYGVGVMFGRYSLDREGLVIANLGSETLVSQMIDETKVSFPIDDDNVIPVLEDDYFKDDIASRFVAFVKATFGEEDLSENIRFIESSLGTTLRKYFVKGFYEDHIKRYKKRPIYWMVASPKKGFMSLIYMHRYEADTFARVRNSYLTEYIAKLEAHKETLALTTTSDTASDRDKKDADKQMKSIDKKLKELIEFDRDKMMSWSQNPTEIDLDDGVKVNYCRFKDILYPMKGLCK